jgi:hypothetical protein
MARLGRSGWPDGVLDVGQGCFMCWISVDGSHVIHPPLRGATRAKLYGAWDGPSITHWLRSLPLLLPERQQEIVPRPRSKPAGGGISREGWLILRRPAPSKPRRGLQYPLKSEYFFSLSRGLTFESGTSENPFVKQRLLSWNQSLPLFLFTVFPKDGNHCFSYRNLGWGLIAKKKNFISLEN